MFKEAAVITLVLFFFSQVQLDPIIADIVLTKGENNVTHLSWEELFKR